MSSPARAPAAAPGLSRRAAERRPPGDGGRVAGGPVRPHEAAAAPLPPLERAQRLGHRLPSFLPVAPAPSGAAELRRKIGAEIEVPNARLLFNPETPAAQGERVADLGFQTEIHLEGPKDGAATLELATASHDQLPADNPRSLTYQAGYLDTWVQTGKLLGEQRLKDRVLVDLVSKWDAVNGGDGPILRVGSDARGAFQVNVSPTKETAPTFLGAFDVMHSLTFDPKRRDRLTVEREPPSPALKESKDYGIAVYRALVSSLELIAGLMKVTGPVPPLILTALKAVSSVPRVIYLQYLRDELGWVFIDLDKNILEVLPRADLAELWRAALNAHPAWEAVDIGLVISQAVSRVALPVLRTVEGWVDEESELAYNELDRQAEGIRSQFMKLYMEKPEGYMEKLPGLEEAMKKLNLKIEALRSSKWRERDAGDAPALKERIERDMLGVLQGTRILVQDRAKRQSGQVQPRPILTDRTDSTLLPVGPEQGEAGVYEIRNPFTYNIPLGDWGQAMELYEQELWKAGVRF